MDTQTAQEARLLPTTGHLLDALTRREFDAFQACLHDDARFRALVPPGPFDVTGSEATASQFRSWFGGTDEFEVVEAALGQVGSKVHVCYRVRMWPTLHPSEARVAEQHLFTSGTDNIETIDLLCSGWQSGAAA